MTYSLVLDIETHSSARLYAMPPERFVRLIGYRWVGESTVHHTTELDRIRALIDRADVVIGHNIHSFDLPAIYGPDDDTPVTLADQGRIYDTFTHATLANPAPHRFTDRHGRSRMADKPAQALAWYGLDEQAYQLGVARKTDDLRALAREYGDPSLPPAARTEDGYGRIPADDPRYRDYLSGDVVASEAVARALLARAPLDAYALREQRIAARAARISRNGFRVNVPAARALVAQQAERRAELLDRLAAYGFPAEGRKPWASSAGRAAILAILADHGITPETRPDWTLTGAGQPSLGAQVVAALTRGTDAEPIGVALAELQGQRSMAQLSLDSVHADGFTHPSITMLQRSGRWSTTKPGLTVWSEHDRTKRQDKAVFVPDGPDDVLLELDYSAADARIVAALSGDSGYAAQFGDDRAALARLTGEPGYRDRFSKAAGAHAINAVLAFGAATVATDPDHYRNLAKRLGHAWNYGGGPARLSATTGLPLADAETFCRGLARAYPRLVRWQERVRADGERGHVVNYWGRRMRVDKGRAYTQSPALHGQSGTREIVCDALLRFPLPLLRRVKAQVHDALVISVPKAEWESWRDEYLRLMTTELDPPRGQRIPFPVECGPPADNWADAGH